MEAEKNREFVRNLSRLIKASGLDHDELGAVLSALDNGGSEGNDKSGLSQLLAGRSAKRVRSKIGRLFGIEESEWDAPWRWEASQFVEFDSLESLVGTTGDPFDAVRRAATDHEPAHKAMIDGYHYKYVAGGDEADRQARLNHASADLEASDLDTPSKKRRYIAAVAAKLDAYKNRKTVYAGGILQHGFALIQNQDMKELVLDGHSGEEVFVVLKGRIDFVFQKRNPSMGKAAPPMIGDLPKVERTYRSTEDGLVRKPGKTLDVIRDILDDLVPQKDEGRVDYDVYHLKENDVIKFVSDVPHGAILNPDYVAEQRDLGVEKPHAIALSVVHGSYFAKSNETKGEPDETQH